MHPSLAYIFEANYFLNPNSLQDIFQQFLDGLIKTSLLEFIAVITGITSVWFSRKENILVFPVGLINTTIYIYLSLKEHLLGEATVNLYYTIMSIYGWMLWTRKDARQNHIVHIKKSTTKEWQQQILFFAAFYIALYVTLRLLKNEFPGAIPWADAFASATAFTAMWLMARKKVESWYWWIATNIASIPLYFVKQYVFTSVYYFILLIFAFWGLAEWRKRATKHATIPFEMNTVRTG
ncbi:MAG: nicotinamide mononucleotide transporter [Chitinophagaceae bacterium]|jgi:nicotinamide mononucleotide transporter|nr:nicotinamide mononucleotide transporter [Chitinophagaceae bacterium]